MQNNDSQFYIQPYQYSQPTYYYNTYPTPSIVDIVKAFEAGIINKDEARKALKSTYSTTFQELETQEKTISEELNET